jgi:hypothetical protein
VGIYIRALEERGERWLTLYGTDTLPIESRRPKHTTVKGQPDVLAFAVDFDELDPVTRAAIARVAAAESGQLLEVVEALFLEQGFPIVVDAGPVEVWSDADRVRGIEWSMSKPQA